MIASGSAMMARREPFVTQTIIGKYEPRIGGMSANERFLSESSYEIFKRERPGNIRTVGDQGPPGPHRRFSTVIEFERGRVKPSWFTPGGKVVADPKGPGFLHTMEDAETRQKRQSRYRSKARLRVAGGAVLRYGIAPAMYIYGVHSLYSRYKTQDIWMQEAATEQYGPILGPALAAGADIVFTGGLAPLPSAAELPGAFEAKHPLQLMEIF